LLERLTRTPEQWQQHLDQSSPLTEHCSDTVKIVSERNKIIGVSVKEDENFLPWDRLLNTYKDVIGEMQSRLN
jgi:hypothetical protein